MSIIVKAQIKNALSQDIFGENLLEKWVDSVDKVADKICIIDNASTDGTHNFLKGCSDKVRMIVSEDDIMTDEQMIQHKLWGLVRQTAKVGDWILNIDVDEFVEPNLFCKVENLLESFPQSEVISIELLNLWDKESYRIDDYWGFKFTPRIFKFRDTYFKNRIHKGMHLGGTPDYIKPFCGGIRIRSPLVHYGYSTKKLREFKFNFYDGHCRGNDKNNTKSIMTKPKLLSLSKREAIMDSLNINNFIDNLNLKEYKKGALNHAI